MKDERMADLVLQRAMGMLQTTIAAASDLTQKDMPARCLQQRET